jgi:hypothetical protein
MTIRVEAVLELSDEAAAALAGQLGREASEERLAPDLPVPTARRTTSPGEVELPDSWEMVSEEHGVTYSWPEGPDVYDPFQVYEGTTSVGTYRLAIGECERVNVRGKDRKYLITHYIGSGGGKRPVSEFLEVDDYAETGDMIAIIKGKGGGAKLYDPVDELPALYSDYRIETYRDRIDYPRSYEKLGIVAHEDDHKTMLDHTLIQVLSRGLDQD